MYKKMTLRQAIKVGTRVILVGSEPVVTDWTPELEANYGSVEVKPVSQNWRIDKSAGVHDAYYGVKFDHIADYTKINISYASGWIDNVRVMVGA